VKKGGGRRGGMFTCHCEKVHVLQAKQDAYGASGYLNCYLQHHEGGYEMRVCRGEKNDENRSGEWGA